MGKPGYVMAVKHHGMQAMYQLNVKDHVAICKGCTHVDLFHKKRRKRGTFMITLTYHCNLHVLVFTLPESELL